MKINRKNIKKLVKTALGLKKLPIKNIQVNRPSPVLLKQVPIILVYTDDEDIKTLTGDKYIQDTVMRDYGVRVDIICSYSNGADDLLDDTLEAIEQALIDDYQLEKSAKVLDPEDTGNDQMWGVNYSSVRQYKIEDDNEQIFYGLSSLWTYGYDQCLIPDKDVENNEDYDYSRTDVEIESTIGDETTESTKVRIEQ